MSSLTISPHGFLHSKAHPLKYIHYPQRLDYYCIQFHPFPSSWPRDLTAVIVCDSCVSTASWDVTKMVQVKQDKARKQCVCWSIKYVNRRMPWVSLIHECISKHHFWLDFRFWLGLPQNKQNLITAPAVGYQTRLLQRHVWICVGFLHQPSQLICHIGSCPLANHGCWLNLYPVRLTHPLPLRAYTSFLAV